MIDLKELESFLISSDKAGYASDKPVKVINEKDHSYTIIHKSGDWMSHDNWFGGEPYGGRTVVFFKNKPSLIMVYYGWVDESVKNFDEVYEFLKESLRQETKPFKRGPKEFKNREFEYANSYQGNITNFSGTETISQNGREIYHASYLGGLVDQRK